MKAFKRALLGLCGLAFWMACSLVWAASPVSGPYSVQSAYVEKKSNMQVEGRGVVVRLLKDDTRGNPHQKFILRTEEGPTVLVAHNIALAPRLQGLNVGETVAFYGEYEWGRKGGTVHWTHRDPRGKHPDGWLRYQGKLYQ